MDYLGKVFGDADGAPCPTPSRYEHGGVLPGCQSGHHCYPPCIPFKRAMDDDVLSSSFDGEPCI